MMDIDEMNISKVLRRKNISSFHTEDAGDYMSSKTKTNEPGNNTKRVRISTVSSKGVEFHDRTASHVKTRKLMHQKQYEYCELDSKADTGCAGSTTRVLECTGCAAM